MSSMRKVFYIYAIVKNSLNMRSLQENDDAVCGGYNSCYTELAT